jgi:hypothetical protein
MGRSSHSDDVEDMGDASQSMESVLGNQVFILSGAHNLTAIFIRCVHTGVEK